MTTSRRKPRKIRINTSDPETNAIWETVKAAREEVASWPAWKRGEGAPQHLIKLSKPDQFRIDRGDYIRAGGDVTCSVCGFKYYDHPEVKGAEWLNRSCDGTLLKL